MATRIARIVFLVCLFLCAGMVLVGIWFGEGVFPEEYFKATFSVFVVGLASFLVWITSLLPRLLERVNTDT